MNKKTIIIGSIILVIILTLVFILSSKPKTIEDAEVLVVSKDFNFKSGATFGGSAIFDNGMVYTWYYSSTKSDYNHYIGSYSLYTKDGIKKFIMDKGKLLDKSVSYSDLSQIKSLINKLKEEDVQSNCNEGKNIYSTLTLYKQDEEYKLVTSSKECEEHNPTETMKKLQDILGNYLKSYAN